MHPAERAFIDQIKRDRGTNLYWLQKLDAGEHFYRDGADITEEFASETRRKFIQADRILATYSEA
jgi:hypothetical protein